MKPGQVIGLTYEPFNFTNKLFRIINLNFQADCTVTIKAVEYDDSAYVISRQRRSAIYSQDSGVDSTIKAPGAPTNLTVSSTKPGFFAISWTNATNFKEATDSTEIYASTSNLSNAELIATVDNATTAEFLIGEFSNRNFWVRHKRIHTSFTNGRRVLHSAYAPDNTSGVAGVSKLLDPSFGFDRQNLNLNFDGSGTLDPSGTGQDTTFTVAKRNLSGTPTIQLLDADGTARSGNGAFTDGTQSISGNSATIDASTFVSTDTPKIVKATLTEGGETFTAIATVSVVKQGVAGAAGIRTTTGVVYYNVGSATAPAGPDANNDAVFTFNTGAFTNLDSGWQVTPPTADPGVADPKFWLANFTAVENSAGNGTSSGSNLTFGSAQEFINFTNAVVFSDLNTNTSTIIHGRNISTGEIQSANFTEDGSGNVTAGTQFDLVNNTFRSKEFEINATGDATFSGNLSAATGTFSGNLSAASGTFTGTIAANSITASSINIAKKGVQDSGGFVKGSTADKTTTPPNASGSITGFITSTYMWGPVTINGVSTNANIVHNMQFTTGDHAGGAAKDYIFSCTINPVGTVSTLSQRYFAMLIAQTGTHSSGSDTYLGSSGYPTSSIVASRKRFFSGGLPALTSATLTAIADLEQNTTYTAVLYGIFYLMGTSPGNSTSAGFPASGQERGFGPVSISVHGISF